MVDVIEACSGCLLYRSLTPGIPVSDLLSLLSADLHHSDFFLLSLSGHIESLTLTPGTYFALRSTKFLLEMPLNRGETITRLDLDLGDIYDQPLNSTEIAEIPIEKTIFALQEQGISLYLSIYFQFTALQSGFSVLSNWHALGIAIIRQINTFISQCECKITALLQELGRFPTPDIVERFVKEAEITDTLTEKVIKSGLDRKYVGIYMELEVKLKTLLLKCAEYKGNRVEKAESDLETAWSTSQFHLQPFLPSSDCLPTVLLPLQSLVSIYSHLRDSISSLSPFTPSDFLSSSLNFTQQITQWTSVLNTLEQGNRLCSEQECKRIALFVRKIVDLTAEITARLKTNFVNKEGKIREKMGNLGKLRNFFECESMEKVKKSVEMEIIRREKYNEKIEKLWEMIQNEAKNEQKQRELFDSSTGSILPSNFHLFPDDFDRISSIHSLAITENFIEKPVLTDKSRELEKELAVARKTVHAEYRKRRVLECELRDLSVESRLLLTSTVSQGREHLKREVEELHRRQEEWMKQVQTQTASL